MSRSQCKAKRGWSADTARSLEVGGLVALLFAWCAVPAVGHTAPPGGKRRAGRRAGQTAAPSPPESTPTADVDDPTHERCALCGTGDLPRIIGELTAAEIERRIAAVRALGSSDSPFARPPLERAAIHDVAPAVRVAALRALAQKRDLRSRQILVQATEDGFLSVRVAAIEALGAFPLEQIRKALARIVMESTSLPERLTALDALRAHRTREAHATVMDIAQQKTELPDSPLGVALERAIRDPPPCPRCVEPSNTKLVSDLFSDSVALRLLTAKGLEDAALPVELKLSLVENTLRDTEPAIRSAGIATLARLTQTAAQATAILTEVATAHPDPTLREAAGKILIETEGPAASEVLGDALRDPRIHVAQAAGRLLVQRADDAATRALVDAVVDPRPEIAVAALRAIDDRDGVSAMLQRRAVELALANPDERVLQAGLRRVDLTDELTSDALIRVMARDNFSEKLATDLLARVEDPASGPARAISRTLASHPSGTVRREVLRLLVRQQGAESQALVQSLQGDPDAEVARAAVAASLRADVDLPEEALRTALTDADATVAEAALAQIERRRASMTAPMLASLLRGALVHPHPDVCRRGTELLLASTEIPAEAQRSLFAAAIGEVQGAPTRMFLLSALRKLGGAQWQQLRRSLLADPSIPARARRQLVVDVTREKPEGWQATLRAHRDDPAIGGLVRRALAGAAADPSDASAESLTAADHSTSDAGETRQADAGLSPTAAPDLSLGEFEPTELDDELPEDGRWQLVVSMTGLGALAFTTVASISETSAGAQVVAGTLGGLLGGATPFLLTLDRDVTAGQATYIATHTAWAAAAGWQLGGVLGLNEAFEVPGADRGLGLLGGLAGVSLATLLHRSANWSGKDAVFANASAVQMGLLVRSLGLLSHTGDPRVDGSIDNINSAAVLAAWGLGLMPATLLNEHLHLDTGAARTVGFSAGVGAWLGAWASASSAAEISGGERLALGLLGGQALGFAVGTLVSRSEGGRLARPAEAILVAALGSAAGAGLEALRHDPIESGRLGLSIDGGTLIALAAAGMMPHVLEFGGRQRRVLGVGFAYGALAGGLLPLTEAEETRGDAELGPRRYVGGAVLGGSVGLLGAAIFAPHFAPTEESLAVGTGTVALLAALGTGTTLLSCWGIEQCPPHRVMRGTEVGGALGMLTAFAIADRVGASEAGASNGVAGALWGAWNGALVAHLDPSAGATATAGSALTFGSLVGSSAYLLSTRADVSAGVGWGLLGASLGANAWGAGLAFVWPERTDQQRVALIAAAPFVLAAVGGVTARAYEQPPTLRAGRIVMGLGLGAWHGALLPQVWQPEAEDSGRRAVGGAVFGGLTGAALAIATEPVLGDWDLGETLLWSAAGNLTGVGLARLRGEGYGAWAETLGFGGLLLGAAVSGQTEYESADAAWMAGAAAIGAWHAGIAVSGQPEERATGGWLLGGLAGGAAVAAATQWTDALSVGDGGEVLLTTGLGDAFGLGMGLLTSAEPGDARPWVLGAGVTLAALSTHWAPRTHFDPNSTYWMMTLGALGAANGSLTGGLPGHYHHERRAGAAALVGGSLGILGAGAVAQWYSPQSGDTSEALATGLVGNLLGLGIGLSLRPTGDSLVADLTMGTGLGLAALSTAWAPRTELTPQTLKWGLSLATLGAWHGTLLGGISPEGWTANEQSVGGGLMGGALGLLTAGAVGQWVRPEPADAAEAFVAAAVGNALGFGVGTLLEPDGMGNRAGWMAGSGLGALLAYSWLAPTTEYANDDVALTVATTGFGSVTGWFLPTLWRDADDASDRARAGSALAGASAGLLLAGPLTQTLELSAGDVVELSAAYAGGSLVGGGIAGLFADGNLRAQTGLQLGAAAVSTGLVATLQEHTDYSRSDIALAGMAASIGTYHGYLGCERCLEGLLPLSAAQRRAVLRLAGGVGLLSGMAIAQVVDYDAGDLIEIGMASLVGNAMGYGLTRWYQSGPPRLTPLTRHALGLGTVAAALVLAPSIRLRREDLGTLAMTTGLGAGLGTWIPATWEPAVAAEQRLGGALFGGGLGLIAGVAGAKAGLTAEMAVATSAGVALSAVAGDGAARLFVPSDRPTARARVTLGVGAGAATSLSIAALVVRPQQVQPAALVVGTLIGAGQGAWLGALLDDPTSQTTRGQKVAGGIELGASTGLGLSLFASATSHRSDADWGEMLVVTGAAQAAGWAVGDFVGTTGTAAWSAELAGIGALALSWNTAPRTAFEPTDVGYLAATTGLGAGYGGWAGHLWAEDPGRGALLGASAGLLLGGAASQALSLKAGDIAEVLFAAGLTHVLVDGSVGFFPSTAPETAHLFGGVAGLATFALSSTWAEATTFSRGDWQLTLLAAAVGGWSGFQLASLVDDAPRTRGALVGGALGGLGGMLTSRYVEPSSTALGYSLVGAVGGNVLGWSLGQLADPEQRLELTAVGTTIGGVGLSLAAGAFGDRLEVGPDNGRMVALVGLMGAWHGGWLSRTWQAPGVETDVGRKAGGGSLLGAGIGLLTGAAFADRLEYQTADIGESIMGWTAANSLGAGLGLLLSEDDRLAVSLMEGLGITGTLLMARVAPETEFRAEDWLFGSLMTSHGLWQGIGTARLFDASPREVAGGIMVATSIGGVTGALIAQHTELSMAETWAAFSGTLWGSWLGAWLGYIYQPSWELDIAGVGALGSDIGLTLSALAVSPIGEMSPARVGWINLFGAAGALFGAGVGALVPTDRGVQKGNVFGTAAGLLSGVILTGVLDLEASGGEASVTPTAAGPGVGSSWGLPDWFPELVSCTPTFGALPMPGEQQTTPPPDGFQIGLFGQWI